MIAALIIISLIVNLILAAIAWTFHAAWRELIEDLGQERERADRAEQALWDSPGIVRDGAPVTQEYGKTGDEGRGATPGSPELDELFEGLRGLDH